MDPLLATCPLLVDRLAHRGEVRHDEAMRDKASWTDICVSLSSVEMASKNVWMMVRSLVTNAGTLDPNLPMAT